jgi:hypothetical protein
VIWKLRSQSSRVRVFPDFVGNASITGTIEYEDELREVSEKLDILVQKLEELRKDMESHERIEETRGQLLEKLGFHGEGDLDIGSAGIDT